MHIAIFHAFHPCVFFSRNQTLMLMDSRTLTSFCRNRTNKHHDTVFEVKRLQCHGNRLITVGLQNFALSASCLLSKRFHQVSTALSQMEPDSNGVKRTVGTPLILMMKLWAGCPEAVRLKLSTHRSSLVRTFSMIYAAKGAYFSPHLVPLLCANESNALRQSEKRS